ncbi:aryl-sulfate sulfotransferase, partial [Haloquadratum walsbyi]
IPAETAPQWHDADYINNDKFAVADMSRDRVFIVNTSTDIIEWQWQADQHFTLESGDDSAQDWTHLNDVEVLPDGRLMVSMRNQDRVIFINQTTGVDESWTLGEEEEAGDRNKILYEQHNPDYIPDEDGGPAIIVADSEQNRVVEFQRVNNSWKETWEYNANLDWPRDADRLPNGHTLITDSRNRRVIEIDESNSVIYEKEIPLPYEAERVGTGPESKNGKSAIRENLSSPPESNTKISTLGRVESLMPDVVVNTISFLLSKYPFTLNGLVTSSTFILTSLIWGALEWRWSDWYVQRPIKNRN